ncbi:N-acyl homoserine lactonase family protein [Nonomuraea glycinis]|uniref:N-acyl homoserine lactonase family protein n=1 Tax=Nonomuraea glycinis TaxID=2047744 RepID=UPI0033BE4AB2
MRLYLLPVAEVAATGAPVPVYLIRTGDGADILVDTGPPRQWAGDDGRPLRAEPGQDVVSGLRRLGMRADDIDYVICTHFDPDHAGNHDAFGAAEFLVQRGHDEVARAAEVPRLQLCRPSWDSPDLRYRLLDGDTEIVPGVSVVESSGHVTGHQSVLVRLPGSGAVLLAADAIPEQAACDPSTRTIYPFDLDARATRDSTAKLMKLAEVERAQVIFGHDARQWRALEIWPRHLG